MTKLSELQDAYCSEVLVTAVSEPGSLSSEAVQILEQVGIPGSFRSPGIERITILPANEWGWRVDGYQFATFTQHVLAEPISLALRPDGTCGLAEPAFDGVSEFGSSLQSFLHCAALVEAAFGSVLSGDYQDWPPFWIGEVVDLLAGQLRNVDAVTDDPASIWAFILTHIGPGW